MCEDVPMSEVHHAKGILGNMGYEFTLSFHHEKLSKIFPSPAHHMSLWQDNVELSVQYELSTNRIHHDKLKHWYLANESLQPWLIQVSEGNFAVCTCVVIMPCTYYYLRNTAATTIIKLTIHDLGTGGRRGLKQVAQGSVSYTYIRSTRVCKQNYFC